MTSQLEIFGGTNAKPKRRVLYTRKRSDGTTLQVAMDDYLWIRSGHYMVRIEHGEIARLRQTLEVAEEEVLSCTS